MNPLTVHFSAIFYGCFLVHLCVLLSNLYVSFLMVGYEFGRATLSHFPTFLSSVLSIVSIRSLTNICRAIKTNLTTVLTVKFKS